MNVGLVGFGMVAERFHAPLLSVEPGLRLTHVVERRSRRAQELYPEVVTLTSAEQLWEAPVDVVVILTPNDSHYSMARQALEAGKHVVVDKPFTVTSAEADELIALARALGRTLTVFHNRRWDGDFLTLKSMLADQALGLLHRYECRWERFRPQPKGGWREEKGEGTGVLYDLGSHMIDQALLLFGRPSRVFCHLESQRKGTEAIDCFHWIGDYGALQVHLSSNCLTAAPAFRYLLTGTSGTYQKGGLDPQEDALQAGVLPGSPGWGQEPMEHWGHHLRQSGERPLSTTVPTEPGNYLAFYSNLAAALRGEAQLEVQPEQARDVIRGLELAYESDRLGGWIAWDV